jgi:hypothetical protein
VASRRRGQCNGCGRATAFQRDVYKFLSDEAKRQPKNKGKTHLRRQRQSETCEGRIPSVGRMWKNNNVSFSFNFPFYFIKIAMPSAKCWGLVKVCKRRISLESLISYLNSFILI